MFTLILAPFATGHDLSVCGEDIPLLIIIQ